jgi:L-2,4-diaminobutyrate decarboxylase
MNHTPESLGRLFDAGAFRQQGHALVDLLADYLEACRNRQDMPILPWLDPQRQLAQWRLDLEGGADFEALSAQLLAASIHTHHPRFVGHQVVPPAPTAALADFFSSFLNNGMAVYEMGPAATAIERLVMQWLGNRLGLGEQADGVMVSGGSLGNLTALLAARQLVGGNVWQEGLSGHAPLAVMVSEEAHYCVARAAQVMGLGEAGVIKVPANGRLQLDPERLEACYQEALGRGIRVFAAVGSACTTSTGSYDDLQAVGEFCRRHGIWFHVDGAHGGAAALSERYRHLLRGAEMADSVVVDFHKMMLAPALTTGVVFRQASQSYAAFSQKAAYLLDEQEQRWYDIAGRTIECTKKSMSLKPFLLLQVHGEQALADYVDYMYDLGAAFADLVERQPDFALQQRPMCNIVCFRYVPEALRGQEEALNRLQAALRQRIIERGHYYCVQTVVRGTRYLRVALMNALTTLPDLEGLLEEARLAAAELA